MMASIRREAALEIPVDFDYSTLSIRAESLEKLALARPQTLAAASRIPGVTPGALCQLFPAIKKRQLAAQTAN